ncbi:C-type lectin 37Da-like [Sabethes cyaneus]|uniref:C-type lectin 37Da-like n=1 Tax=Sabethes cyaneus TaxID=53552 RepID=UPI00237ED8CC|nr:C-type lectin 37Da-like [Sabethes cyaneus]
MVHPGRVVILLLLGLNHFVLMASTNKKYFIPSIRANWFKANEFCNSLQTRLTVIKSKEENEAIASYVKTTDKYSDECSFWIGGTDLADEGVFIWTATGERVSYSNWGPSEPNNHNGNEHCMQLAYIPAEGYHWTWNDNVCNGQSLYFVCENVEFNCVTNF